MSEAHADATEAAVRRDGREIGAVQVDEADWRAWLRAIPEAIGFDAEGPVDATAARLVVVAPHPDDEVLACGGLIANRCRRGGEVLVVAVTDGQASHPGDPAWPPDRLADARRQESAAGLLRLAGPNGTLPRVEQLGLPDGAVAAQADRLADALRDLLRPGDRVVTTWRLDGHPDHDATGTATARAATEREAVLLEAPVWMWHWSHPGDPRVPWRRLRAVHLRPAERDAKRSALAEHATQLAPQSGGGKPVLDTAILHRAERDTEYLFMPAAGHAGPIR